MRLLREAFRAFVTPARVFSSSARPFKVLGVQQIAIGGESKAVMPHLVLDFCVTVRSGLTYIR